MRKMAIAAVISIGLMPFGMSSISAAPANSTLLENLVATDAMVVQVKRRRSEVDPCAFQCRRLTGMRLKRCHCECGGGFWWYPAGPCW
jgi:hypothetical protein